MYRLNYTSTLVLSISLFFFSSCIEDKKRNEDDSSNAQIRVKVLTNIGDNLVVPTVNNLKSETEILYSKSKSFNESPDLEKLDALREQWEKTFKVFLQAAYFEMNPVKVIVGNDFTRVLGAFPVNTTSIEERISNGVYSTNNFLFSTRGLNTVEYLIYGHNKTKEEIVESFVNSSNRKVYLDSITSNISRSANRFKSLWDIYLPSFKNDPSRTQFSAIFELFNRFIVEFERTKNERIQFPLGERAGQTQTLPDQVDARYSGKSLDFVEISLKFSHDIWRGKTTSTTDSTGLDDLLETVSVSGRDLAAETRVSWAQVFASFDEIDRSRTMEQLVAANDSKLKAMSARLKDHTAYVKSRFTTVTGIVSDNKTGDGD
ncbi:MAG: imelysin family protein [Cytophagales bacterium]